MVKNSSSYVGRLAPSPTGDLHLGHARTFWIAAERARKAGGKLLLRNDDIDANRFKFDYVATTIEDLHWLGFNWEEPMVSQSDHIPLYRAALQTLHTAGLIYPCAHSRRDVLEAAGAPHEGSEHDEPVYPTQFRPPVDSPVPELEDTISINWRFRVPDGEELTFQDGSAGKQTARVGHDFGDFVVWRKDNIPSYQLTCVVDEIAMGITEVVRGADLIRSTFRQLLLFRALGHTPPAFYHCPLMLDDQGERLAKRHDSLSLRTLREQGVTPEEIISKFGDLL